MASSSAVACRALIVVETRTWSSMPLARKALVIDSVRRKCSARSGVRSRSSQCVPRATGLPGDGPDDVKTERFVAA